jgi:hypothetical protein
MPVEAKQATVIIERLPEQQADLFATGTTPAKAGHVTKAWVPHWGNCPDAEEWRKGR